jgi:hypothetical protein
LEDSQGIKVLQLFHLLKGTKADVLMRDGERFEGIVSAECQIGETELKSVLRVQTEEVKGRLVERRTEHGDSLSVSLQDFTMISYEVDFAEIRALRTQEADGHHAVPFFKETEHDLPGEAGGERELQKSTWGSGMGLEDETWDAPNDGGDQFERN